MVVHSLILEAENLCNWRGRGRGPEVQNQSGLQQTLSQNNIQKKKNLGYIKYI